MKLQLVKFNESVKFQGEQVSYLEADKHHVDMDYDPKTLILTIKSSKDEVQTNLHNCVYWKVIPVPVQNLK